MIAEGSRFRIPIPEGALRCNLIFWVHDWSGHAEITCGSQIKTVNLYSHVGGCERVILNQLADDEIIIRHIGVKDRRSSSDQVILYRAVFGGNKTIC